MTSLLEIIRWMKNSCFKLGSCPSYLWKCTLLVASVVNKINKTNTFCASPVFLNYLFKLTMRIEWKGEWLQAKNKI